MMDKTTLMTSLLSLVIGAVAQTLAAAFGTPIHFMAVTAVVSLIIAAFGVRRIVSLGKSGASISAISSAGAYSMGLAYAWGALALFATYVLVLPRWHEWPVFCGAFAAVAAISFAFAATVSKDAERGKDDQTLLKIGQILTISQLAGTIVAIVGLLLDPDKQFLNESRADWAAQTIFFFGAIALAVISAAALMYTRNRTVLPGEAKP
jgi:MFS family permease